MNPKIVYNYYYVGSGTFMVKQSKQVSLNNFAYKPLRKRLCRLKGLKTSSQCKIINRLRRTPSIRGSRVKEKILNNILSYCKPEVKLMFL